MRNASTMLVMLLMSATATALAADVRTVRQQVAATAAGQVLVSNVAGSIMVQAWDRPEVAAAAELHGEGLGLQVSSEGMRTEVRVTGYDESRSWFGLHLWLGGPFGIGARKARLTVYVPRGSALQVSAVSAELTSSGVLGSQRLHSVSGAVRADIAGSAVQVGTVSGDIELRGSGAPSQLTVRSVSGDVALVDGGGDLEASTVSGALQATVALARNVRLSTTSGSITFQGVLAHGASLTGHSISGAISVRARAATGFSYEVHSVSGAIDNCFGQSAQRTAPYGPGRALSGKRGAGDGSVQLRTVSGELSICDRTAQL